MSVDSHRRIVRDALEQHGEGPYTFSGLLQAYDLITDDFCRLRDPACSRIGVLDWLLAIGPQGQQHLLDEINSRSGGAGSGLPARESEPDFCWWAR